jgi:AraC-like DNA-binding protein
MLYQIENRSVPISTSNFIRLSTIPHIHTHLELIYMEEGSSVATVDNKEYLIEKGDLFLSFPNQIHYYHDRCTVKGYLFIFSPDLFKDFKEIFQTQIPYSPIIKCTQLPSDLRSRLKKIMNKNRSESGFEKIAAKGDLLSLLAELLSKMTLVNTPTVSDSIKSVLTYCSENYTEPLTLEQISKELHLNKFYISHIFNERLQISFTDFINSLRIEHACNLLERGSNITDVALSSGFSSVRTFNRVFVQNMEMTPRDYVKLKENGTPVLTKKEEFQLCCDNCMQ